MKRSLLTRPLGASVAALTCALAAPVLTPAHAQALPIVCVEEDWELLLGEPDINSHGPQVSCTFSPFPHLDSVHAVFELNHRTLPAFASGGMQLQLWYGESSLACRMHPSDSVMQLPGELVKWTQVMRIDDGWLHFEIKNGSSMTWGEFGQGYLRFQVPVGLKNLDDYSPTVSVENSGAGFAANRVQCLLLRRVRYTLADGQTIVDSTVRVAHAVN